MRIIFKQSKEKNGASLLQGLGMERCYLKHIVFADDRSYITRKRHHHTDFEIHMIERGCQVYETDAGEIALTEGQFLLIPPTLKHCAIREDAESSKYSVTFGIAEASFLHGAIPLFTGCIPEEVCAALRCIREEHERREAHFDALISLRVAECVLRLLRLAGGGGAFADRERDLEDGEDARLLLAKQYVKDNLTRPITVSELSSYCAIGEKQLTRLFLRGEGIPVAEYVRRERCAHIEHLLADSSLSLREISEEMNFNNEYYFNAFFKKQSGMTPGAYRRSVLKK